VGAVTVSKTSPVREPAVSWKLFEETARTYEGWYATPLGKRADQAERALLAWLQGSFSNARDVLDIGCGTGHFTEWLAASGLRTRGLDRSSAMLAELRRRFRTRRLCMAMRTGFRCALRRSTWPCS